MILGLFKISGHSMMPTFSPNDGIVASSIPYLFSKPAVGDIILLKYNGKMLVKRIKEIHGTEIILTGDNLKDSLKIKPIKRKEILGKVIIKL